MKFNELIRLIKTDLLRYNYKILKGIIYSLFGIGPFQAVILYRLSRFFYLNKVMFFHAVFNRINIILNGCEISPRARIGDGFKIAHTLGIVIGHNVKIGKNFTIFQNASLGAKEPFSKDISMPTIHDNVIIYAGAKIFGKVNIGNNVIVGANVVLATNIPDNSSIFMDKNLFKFRGVK
jgi:serine O-acetyltransferase